MRTTGKSSAIFLRSASVASSPFSSAITLSAEDSFMIISPNSSLSVFWYCRNAPRIDSVSVRRGMILSPTFFLMKSMAGKSAVSSIATSSESVFFLNAIMLWLRATGGAGAVFVSPTRPSDRAREDSNAQFSDGESRCFDRAHLRNAKGDDREYTFRCRRSVRFHATLQPPHGVSTGQRILPDRTTFARGIPVEPPCRSRFRKRLRSCKRIMRSSMSFGGGRISLTEAGAEKRFRSWGLGAMAFYTNEGQYFTIFSGQAGTGRIARWAMRSSRTDTRDNRRISTHRPRVIEVARLPVSAETFGHVGESFWQIRLFPAFAGRLV